MGGKALLGSAELQRIKVDLMVELHIGQPTGNGGYRAEVHARPGGHLGELARFDLELPEIQSASTVRGENHAPVVGRPGWQAVVVVIFEHWPGFAPLRVQQPEATTAAHAALEDNRLAVKRPGGSQVVAPRRSVGELDFPAGLHIHLPDRKPPAGLQTGEEQLLRVGRPRQRSKGGDSVNKPIQVRQVGIHQLPDRAAQRRDEVDGASGSTV